MHWGIQLLCPALPSRYYPLAMSLNPIRDHAYQFFQQEALELLQTLETGLLTLRDEFTVPQVHNLMRAAHSIKGGAASVNLPGIQKIAHKLEDVLRALYRREGPLDSDLDEALLLAYDCLRVPLQTQVTTGSYDEELAWHNAEPIFTLLESFLSEDLGANIELPTAAELGVDIVHEVFTGDVTAGLARLNRILANPQAHEVKGEIYTTAEVFVGIGELLSLPGFTAIAQHILQALQLHPADSATIGHIAVENLRVAQQAVLAGDRSQGGQPSLDLLAFSTNALALKLDDLSPSSSSPDLIDFTDFTNGPEDRWDQDLADLLTEPSSPEPAVGAFSADRWELNFAETSAQSALSAPELAALDPLDHLTATLSYPLPLEDEPVGNLLEDIFGPGNDPADRELIDYWTEPENSSSDRPEDIFNPRDDELSIALAANDSGLTPDAATLPGIAENITTNARDGLLSPLPSVVPSLDVLPPAEQPTVVALANRRSAPPTPAAPASQLNESVRVDTTRLERINNLVGELVTQENGSLLHSQQLQSQLKALQQRFNRFEQLTKKFEAWMDQSQRTEVRGHQVAAATAAPQHLNRSAGTLATATLVAASDAAGSITLNFDPLQMDSYSDLYTVIQAGVEETLQMAETIRDITMITQQAQQTQRKKQQTLKQVRNDLLWARMMPMGDLLARFPRMVRDLSQQYQKQVNFSQTGGFTLIDKGTLEKLYDPLVHLVRNAFDHGTESPADRIAQGKPAAATIEVRAYHRGNQTFIEVRDDGRGIDLEKVRAATIAQDLLSAAEAATASPERLYHCLFSPNFSTATTVSELSGRGMGLSAVQTQVKALKGTIILTSIANQGTTFTIRLPLTLSIAKLLVFNVNSNYMAIAVDSLAAIVTAPDTDIQTIQGRQFYQYEDQLIPLYPTSAFAHHYPLPRSSTGQLQFIPLPQQDKTPLLLIADGDHMIALEVDQILTEQELVIKPFGAIVAPPTYLYGCTILGDGSLVPVIDGSVLVNQWKDPASQPFNLANTLPAIAQSSWDLESSAILVIDDSLTTRQNLTLTLQKAGYHVIQAGDGREALEKLRQEPQIQAIFCDVEMPVMNGFEFLSACRKQDPPIRQPIIMLSSRSSEKHQGMAKLLGASHYLTKPYLEQGLLITLRECLQAHALD